MTTDAATAAPRVTLGSWPTALEPAPRLAAALGLNSDDLWIKREDLGGLGGGGNKLRKLEFSVGAALAEGADTLVTIGGAQSNHARLTAAVGVRLGLQVVLVFPGSYDGVRGGNVALDGLFGARVHWAGDVDFVGLGEVAAAITEQLRAGGARPVLLGLGGSSAIASRGYLEAGHELLGQLPDLHTAVVALGSGGTMAGLVAALGPERVFGVEVGALVDPAGTVAELAGQVGPRAVAAEELRISLDQIGAGYPDVTDQSMAAMRLVGRTEALVLDPIYTGRAMAALVAAVSDGTIAAGVKTVFLHTGGMPGLFGYQDAINRAEQGLGHYPG
ncbi:MAG TPA: pyridoxal-phosphate dependent enzyme [Jatrophihabitans sp.]|jgi:D-cysteine desulfhydrase|uniref:pyridoxal-phosphate dependent enzyme n=1 Tax=Jatrophihabitans sp. TaxID=1932789 RepID=UPI002F09A1CB